MRTFWMSSLIFWSLFVGLAPTGCAGYPDDLVGSDELFSDDAWQNDSFAEILPDQGLSGNGTGETDPDALDVILSAPLSATSDEFVEIEARVTNAADGDLYYLWEYALDDNTEFAAKLFAQTGQVDDYVKDWNTLRFYPQDLFPDVVLDGAILRIRAHALEIGERTREGFGDRLLTIRGYPHTEVDQDEQPEEEEAEEDIGDDDNEQVDDGALADGGSGGGDGEGNDPAPDPCEGITTLTVTLPASLTMSLYQNSVNLSPTICSGTPPYTHDWTPTTYLEDQNAGLGGGPTGSVTSEDADFAPLLTGDFTVTVEVTDDNADTATATVTITVNDYNPLIAEAGDDVAVTQNDSLSLAGNVLGGSGSYSYSWTPGGPTTATFNNVPTAGAGETTYTFTVTDAVTGATVSDTAKVVVFAAGQSCSSDYELGVGSGDFVGFDPNYGSAGQAVVVSGDTIVLFDLATASVRATLALPSSGQGLAIDASRGRAYATTRLSGQFTRSVQVIDLDNATLGANIGLTGTVAFARGLAVVPSTGDVLVAVSGANDTDGLMVISGGTSLGNAMQNMHHTDSFQSPVDVAVIEQGSLAVAVVANMAGSFVTLVPLSAITFTPDDSTGGGQPSLAQVAINGAARATIAEPAKGRVIIGWNDGDQGRIQVVSVTDNQTGVAGSEIALSGMLLDQGLAINTSTSQVAAALGSNGVSLVDIGFGIESALLQGDGTSAFSVATEDAIANRVLIVGNSSKLSERCP